MSENNLIIYQPSSRRKIGFFSLWILMFQNILKSHELIYQLFKRDFLMMYKKSFLGMGWLILAPIIGIISWLFLNKAGILKPGDIGVPYPAYVLLGSTIWGLFMGFFTNASQTLAAASSFIMQVKYPHEALLAKQAAQALATFIIAFVINLIVLAIFHVYPKWEIVFFPLTIIPLFFLGSGLGLILSVPVVISTDVAKASEVLLQLVFFITPIVYAPDISNPLMKKIVEWNPLTYLVSGARDIIIFGKINNLNLFIYASIAAFIFFLLSWRLFHLAEEKAIEKMI